MYIPKLSKCAETGSTISQVPASGVERSPQPIDGRLSIFLAKYRGTRYEHGRPGFRDRSNGRRVDPAIDFNCDIGTVQCGKAGLGVGNLAERGWYERLTAKAGIHRHNQKQVQQISNLFQPIEACPWIDCEPSFDAVIPNHL